MHSEGGAPLAHEPMRIPLALRWSDMDALGHVNNVQFLRLLEEARIHALESWFGRAVDLRVDADSTAVLVAAQSIEYLAPLHYRREPIEVGIWITRLGDSSFDVGYTVEADGKRCAVAQTTMVNVDLATSRPCPLTPQQREGMSAHLGAPVPWRASASSADVERSA